MPNHKAKHDIFLTEDRAQAVRGDDPKAKFLVARAGTEIPDHVAARHGIEDGQITAPLPDMTAPRTNVAPKPRERVK